MIILLCEQNNPWNKEIRAEIIIPDYGNILNLNKTDLQKLRSSIAYVQQKNEYTEMGNVKVKEIISESDESHSGCTNFQSCG